MGSWDWTDEPAGSNFATDPFSGGSYLDRFSTDYEAPLYAPNRGFFGDVTSNLGRGGVDALGLLGHSLDQFGIETGLEEWASSAEERYMFMRPDLQEALGQEGWFKTSAMGALRSAPASLVPLGAAAAGTMLGTPALGAAAGIGSLVGLFGAGTYNQSYREAIDQGLDADAAHNLALETAAWEVGTEGLSDAAALVTGGLLGAPIKGITKSLNGNIKSTLKSVMQAGAPNFLRATGINVGAEVGSESLNSFMQTRAQIKAGLDPGLTPAQAALASIGPSLFLSGGITLATQGTSAARRNQISRILSSKESTRDQKAAASNVVETALRKENPTWADNWRQVSDHILSNNGTFDINQDFVQEAAKLTAQPKEEAEAERLAEKERRENEQIQKDPMAFAEELLGGGAPEEALLGAREEIELAPSFLRTEDLAADDLLQELGDTPFAEQIRTTLGLSPTAAKAVIARDQRMEGREERGVLPGGPEQPLREPPTERPDVPKRPLNNAEFEQKVNEIRTAQGTQERIQRMQELTPEKENMRLNQYMDEQLAAYDPEAPGVERREERAKRLADTRKKLRALGVPLDAQLAPDLFEAIEATTIEEIEADGFAAVEDRLIPPEAAEQIASQNRTLNPQEKAQLVQAAQEYNTLMGTIGDQQAGAGEDIATSPEQQQQRRELEKEIADLTGKTDEDLETIAPGITQLMDEGTTFAESPTGTVEAALNQQIKRIDDQVITGEKTDAEGRNEATLIRGLVDNDPEAIGGALSQYTDEGQLAVLTNTALQFRDALDNAEQTPGNLQLKNRIYQLISSYATTPAEGNRLPKGFVEWEAAPVKGAGEMYTAVDETTGKIYILEREAIEAGERGGTWRIYSTVENENGDIVEDVIAEGYKGQPVSALVRNFYKTSGEGPLTQAVMPKHQVGKKIADKTGEYTIASAIKNFWKSKDGVWVAVPRGGKHGNWGVMREADRATWFDLTSAERTAAWYEVDGKTMLDQETALNTIRQEIGETLDMEQPLMEAESEYLTEFKEQEQKTGLEQGSKGPQTKRKPGKTKGQAEQLEQQLAESVPPSKVKKVKPGPVITEQAIYRVAAKTEKAARELRTRLDRLAEKYLMAFEDKKIGRLGLIRSRALEALGYKNPKKAPKEAQNKVDQFLNGVISSGYKTRQMQIDSLQERIDNRTAAKKAVQSQKKTTTQDSTRVYDSRIRAFNREIKALKEEQATLRGEMDTYEITAADLLGVKRHQAANRLLVSSTVELSPAVTVPEKPRSLVLKEKRKAPKLPPINEPQPAPPGSIVFVPTTAEPRTGFPKVVHTEKYHKIWQTETGFKVELPNGTTSKEYKTQGNAQRFIIDKFNVDKKYRPKEILPPREMQHTGGNGWSPPAETDAMLPDYAGISTQGVLKSENGKLTAVYTALERKSPFLPSHIWEVTNQNGDVVAKYITADELTSSINGATKTGYLSKAAKATTEQFEGYNVIKRTKFAAGDVIEPTGNTAEGVASNLESFLKEDGTKRWMDNVTVVQTFDEAPTAGEAMREQGVDGPILGFYDPATNQVTLIADHIPPGQEQDVFLHEGLHFVMENDSTFKRTKDALLGRITTLKNREGAVQDAWNEAAEKNPNASEKEIAEEAYAYMLQNPDNRNIGIVRQAIAAVKRFLIKMRIPVGALGLTDADLVAIGTRAVMKGGTPGQDQLQKAGVKFATAASPVPESREDRSQTGEQLSIKSTLQDDGGRRHVFAPITDATPKSEDGKPKSDHVFSNAITGKYYHYTNFNTETQDFDGKRDDLSKEEYDILAEQYSGEQEEKDAEWWDSQEQKTKAQHAAEGAKSFYQKTKKTAKSMVQSISEGVRNISPKAYGRLNKMEFEIQDKIRTYGIQVRPWMEKYAAMGDKDRFLLDQALRNGDFRARNRIFDRNGITAKEWQPVQDVLNEIKQGALETGLIDDAQLLKNYFPRAIKTGKVDDLVASMRAEDAEFADVLGDELEVLGKRIKETEGRDMTEADRMAHIQKLMNTGHYQFIPKPGASKDRNITSVLNEQAQFYDTSTGALEGHLYDMVQAIEYRRMLGKNNLTRPVQMKELRGMVNRIDELENKENPSEKETEELRSLHIMYESKAAGLDALEADIEDSIVSYVNEELGKGNPQASELIHLIRARLTQRGTHGAWGTFRDVGYMFTLGSPMSAITQIGDLALSAIANNPVNTAAAVFNVMFSRFTGNKRMSKEFFDFSHSLGDFAKRGIEDVNTQKALDKVLTWSGLKGMDLFGKDVFLTAALKKNQKMSKAEFVQKKADLFGGDKARAGRAWSAIKNNQLDGKDRDALFVLFNDLSQWQPISLSEMPAMYNTAGNGRIFYMLKSFNLKALNSLYRESVATMRNPESTGAQKSAAALRGVGIVLTISMAGAGADEVKDFILGKEVDFSDNVMDNIISMSLTNRFTLEKGIAQGTPFTSIINGFMPPVRFADNIIDDMAKFSFDRENFKFKSLNLVPVVGRIGYSRTEAGRTTELTNRKRDLYDEIKENARAGRALYAGAVRTKVKAYNEIAKQLGEDRLGYKQLKNVRSKERKKVREEARG